VIIYN